MAKVIISILIEMVFLWRDQESIYKTVFYTEFSPGERRYSSCKQAYSKMSCWNFDYFHKIGTRNGPKLYNDWYNVNNDLFTSSFFTYQTRTSLPGTMPAFTLLVILSVNINQDIHSSGLIVKTLTVSSIVIKLKRPLASSRKLNNICCMVWYH